MSPNSNYALYKITHAATGKAYIGQTSKGANSRWAKHRSRARTGLKGRLYDAMRRYGISAFDFRVLVVCQDAAYLKACEVLAIAAFDTYSHGYNDTKGGDGGRNNKGRLGQPHTAETRAKIAKSRQALPDSVKKPRLGVKHTPETNAKISAANLGRKMTDEQRAKMSLSRLGRKSPHKGHPQSEQTRQKIAASMRKLRAAQRIER